MYNMHMEKYVDIRTYLPYAYYMYTHTMCTHILYVHTYYMYTHTICTCTVHRGTHCRPGGAVCHRASLSLEQWNDSSSGRQPPV